jgi:hypothetical protein
LCINSCLIYWRKAGVSFSILASYWEFVVIGSSLPEFRSSPDKSSGCMFQLNAVKDTNVSESFCR